MRRLPAPLNRYWCCPLPPRAGPLDKTVGLTLGSLGYARTCYAHLAGWLGVTITDALQREGYLAPAAGRAFAVTDRGREWFEQRGIATPRLSGVADSKLARQCPDWTERRPHLAGTLGVNMYKRFSGLGWIAPIPQVTRGSSHPRRQGSFLKISAHRSWLKEPTRAAQWRLAALCGIGPGETPMASRDPCTGFVV
jgi:hypothetical protein